MYGEAIHDACVQLGRELGSVGPPDAGFDRQFDERLAMQNKPRTDPRYGVKATAAAATILNAALEKYPDDLDLYRAAHGMIKHAYNQSSWIEKVWRGLVQAAQEAER